MDRSLFNEIVTAVIDHDPFFCSNMDCARRQGISGLVKCTSTIHQLKYGVHADFLDEYMQISERTSRTALDYFCQAVMQIYGPEFLRKPTMTDIEKLYLHQEEKHGFPGIGYYLVYGIYPELAPLVKTIPEPADDDHKRILFKEKQKSARKDVERAFGVLKKKWAILANPTRALRKDRIINMMSLARASLRSAVLKLVDSRGILPVVCWIEHGESRDDVQTVQQALEVTDKVAKYYYVNADKQKSSNSNSRTIHLNLLRRRNQKLKFIFL
ncbi:zf-CCHC domain-containing protein [Tanacetum coccineum]|uniref:Zf-CCHC domain-containing protein n=1 Tax=Tanacetum coccineum TaxID=301880 RepID=A0ABQ5ACA5_9ASTR